MKKVMIKENEKGILYKDGRLAGLLGAGSYRLSKRKSVEILPIETRIVSENCTIERLLENADIAAETVTF